MTKTREELERTIERYELEIQRLKAVTAIQNCMAHYETVHLHPSEIKRTPECFAMWRSDISCEVSDWGCFFGPDAIKGFWESMILDEPRGAVFFHALASPAIEVAGNGNTAKVTWASPGFETMPPFKGDKGGHKSYWCWGKYGIDFIRNPETGEWKIWHMKWFRTIRSDFYMDWYKDSIHTMVGMPDGGYDHKDRKTSVFHRPYRADEIPHILPMTPEPYEDYNGDFRWIYGGKEYEEKYGIEYPNYEKFYNVDYPAKI